MGLFDVLTGKRKVKQPAPDRLFAMSTAYVTLSTSLGISSAGRAAIVFQPLATADFQGIVRDMEELVRATAAEGGTTVESAEDRYGFRWLILAGDDFDSLVVGLNAVSTALQDGGYGERLLCVVFAFTGADRQRLYGIYNFKRGRFYPFVPGAGEGQRDNEAELRLRAQIGSELPVEPELERWLALWGIPI